MPFCPETEALRHSHPPKLRVTIRVTSPVTLETRMYYDDQPKRYEVTGFSYTPAL